MKQRLDIIIQYLQKNYLSYWLVLGCDTLTVFIATWASYVIVHYITETPVNFAVMCKILSVSVISGGGSALLFQTYRNTIRFSQIRDLFRLAGIAVIKSVCIAAAVWVYFDLPEWHNRQKLVLVLFDGMLTFIILAGFRVQLVLTYEYLLELLNRKNMRILIYGIDEKSVALKIRLANSYHYKVVGFYIYGEDRSIRKIISLSVFSFNSEGQFAALMRKKRIQGILFASYEDTQREEKRLLQYCKQYEVKTLIAPDINEADENGNFHQWVRPIKIEDLLGRSEIQINMSEVMKEFCDKVVLVTGAAGSIGSELCRQLAQMKIKQLVMFDSAETPLHNVRLEFEKSYPGLDFVPVIGDVRVKDRLRMIFELYHPQIIFHAAAYKHVPLMEENPCEAVLVNVIGSRQVADMALKYGAEKMIMVSTDKAVNPTNVMGASKRLAEIYVQSLGYAVKEGKVQGNTRFITTRFGNVLGSNGSVIPHFKEQIENGGPVTVTHPEIIRFFMTIPEACRLVMEAATMGKGNEIFVFEMGKAVKIVDLATRMIELAGYKPGDDIKIEFTGLRPGEKLYEEVLSDKENTIPTNNKKIKIAKVRRYEYEEVRSVYIELEQLSRSVRIMDTVSLMKQFIPEFKSKNSPLFEKLDTKLIV
ncbi:nucleoside-diphosphate sugar epimerase/dehydratase [Bacteroides ovatus]|jgi:FlaA1/EpsC-like NDP-sugar epimerase|uniref:polysaccharide biosynthesis protein n=1 Tax=Bacteroides ovatus TaxID=28116 RepID=UPI00233E75C4|nr:nucleoside-diphosphate sugar epimerase/dehydratase [Bacteroides ovatus]MDC2433130.1 nucleoside-diphosphate sugar epimerase/dehydratase [Bacteroides ovatus]MDC2448288.1 nucleoside-diphosphate sugar epimerase/dehydratase [Bacteroides ovatus]MDC2463677.1 nucleoside-diphosphate sugar epimerase/dehydratase [Bacteroides ovatus]MDC2483845.1 nucleoside-diphosphate sugar epimerase/dehydratase [Bacteroides ovatus]